MERSTHKIRTWSLACALGLLLLAVMPVGALAYPGGQALVASIPGNQGMEIPDTSTTIVISEFRTRGPSGAADEFIEIFNLSQNAVAIGGWVIVGSNSSGATSIRATIPSGVTLSSGCRYLFTNSGSYSGSTPGDQTYATGVTDDGGIALCTASGCATIIDQVGMSSGSAYKEGTPLSPTTTNMNQSQERLALGVNGTDTDNNAADFLLNSGTSNPQNIASTCTPLAVTLAQFVATTIDDHILVTWETVSELNNAGFNLYRSTTDAASEELLAYVPSQAPGSQQGVIYEWEDWNVSPGETWWYWLEDIDFGGATTLHGPVSTTIQGPTAVELTGLKAGGSSRSGDREDWLLAVCVATLAAAVAMWILLRNTKLAGSLF